MIVMARTPLARFIDDRLHERAETPEQFAVHIGISPSGLYKLLRGAYISPRTETLDKIAVGFGMSSAAELLAAVEAREDDPIEQAIRQRTAEMREAVRDTPREFWSTIIKATFDRAIDGARDMAQLLADLPSSVTSHEHQPNTKPTSAGNGDIAGPESQLPFRQTSVVTLPQRALATA